MCFMSIEYKATIQNDIEFFGKPKNMGSVVNVKFVPSTDGCGIVFKRTDLLRDNIIEANYDTAFIDDDNTLSVKNSHGVVIRNVEPFLSAVCGMKISNIIVEMDGDAMPHIDGNTEPILFLLSAAGVQKIKKPLNIPTFSEEINEKFGNCFIKIKQHAFLVTAVDGFTFDTFLLPYKDYLALINDRDAMATKKRDTVSLFAMIALSHTNRSCSVEVKNFDKRSVFEALKKYLK